MAEQMERAAAAAHGGLHPVMAQALAPFIAPAPVPLVPRLDHPMRRRTDFSPVAAVALILQDMPMPDVQGLQDVVEALSKKLDAPSQAGRFAAVVERLGDVHMTLEDCKPRDERAEREWDQLQSDMAADLRRRSA